MPPVGRTSSDEVPASLLWDAWRAGAASRLTLVFGLIVSAALTALVVLGTVRFVVHTVHEPALPWALKAVAVVFVPFFVLILLVSVPVAWLMHILAWLSRRRRTEQQAGR
jgi:heme/copper-type cytochrome/quinol oxidase subunit 2